jgi:lycopene cyclase domain-containing protein
VSHFIYLGVLLGCLAGALWLEPIMKVGVLRRWRRLLLTLLPVVVVFTVWDVAAIHAGHWTFDRGQITGVLLPGRLPLEELLFFVVVPVCAVLGFEAVRKVLARSAQLPGNSGHGDLSRPQVPGSCADLEEPR